MEVKGKARTIENQFLKTTQRVLVESIVIKITLIRVIFGSRQIVFIFGFG